VRVHRRHEQLALGALVEGCLGAMIISVDLLDCRLLVELDHAETDAAVCTNDGYGYTHAFATIDQPRRRSQAG